MPANRVTSIKKITVMKKTHWIGLESYSEENASLFFGRDAEISALSDCIFHNNQTIIYGPSGIGKSSIIKAGILGLARKNDFLPVYIRLAFSEESERSHTKQIIDALKQEAEKNNVDIEQTIPYVDPENVSLWEFFHCNRFVSIYDLPVIPLIIIDQFEEIFTLATDKEERDHFFLNISEVCDNIVPDYIKENLRNSEKYIKYPDTIDIRLVFSLREDFLPRLEEQADNIPAFKRNRFSLQAINGEQAMEIIMKPEPGLVSHDVALSILKTVTGNEKLTFNELKDETVEPSLLSLFCSELDAKRDKNGETIISQELVNDFGKYIIQDFYRDKMEHISASASEYLEKRLLTRNGFRDSAALDDALNDPNGLSMEEYHYLSKNRVIRTEERNGTKRIEFTHDILCKAACEYRDNRMAILEQEAEKKRQEEEKRKLIERQEEEKKELIRRQEEELARIEEEADKARRKRRVKMVSVGVLTGIVIIILLAMISFFNTQAREEQEKAEELRKSIGKINVNIALIEDAAVKSLWWEANLKVTLKNEQKDSVMLNVTIDKTKKDSTYTVPVDKLGYQSIHIDLVYAGFPSFKIINQNISIESLVKKSTISVPVKLSDPYLYGGQLVFYDDKTMQEYNIKNAIVILNNEVDFTDAKGQFLFHQQDSVDLNDEIIIIKKDYQTVYVKKPQEMKINRSDIKFQKIKMNLVDSVNYLTIRKICDSISDIKNQTWKFSFKQPIRYVGMKDGSFNDNFYFYMKEDKGKIWGVYYYNKDGLQKKYSYHFFNGTMDNPKLDTTDMQKYRAFEIISKDIANNEETIRGRKSASRNKWEFNIFMHSQKIAESTANFKQEKK